MSQVKSRRNKTTEQAAQSADSATSLIAAIGQALINYNLYGEKHSVATDALSEAYVQLQKYLQNVGKISFGMNENELLVNGYAISMSNPLVQHLGQRLNKLKISNFSIKPGMGSEEFRKLIALLLDDEVTDATGDRTDTFRDRLSKGGFRHVTAKKVTIRELADDEMVVGKDSLDNLSLDPGLTGAGGSGSDINCDEPVTGVERGEAEDRNKQLQVLLQRRRANTLRIARENTVCEQPEPISADLAAEWEQQFKEQVVWEIKDDDFSESRPTLLSDPPQPEAVATPEATDEDAPPTLCPMLSYLRGADDVDTAAAQTEIAATTSEELAELVIEAANLRMREDSHPDKSRAEAVADTVHSAATALRSSIMTGEGREELKESLRTLETELRRQLTELGLCREADDACVVAKAFEQIRDAV